MLLETIESPSKCVVMDSIRTEQEVIDDLHTAVAMAIRQERSFDEDSLTYLTETKLHKLCYYAISGNSSKRDGLRATYSWYLAGAHFATDGLSVKSVKSRYREISDSELNVYDSESLSQISHDLENVRLANKRIKDNMKKVWFNSRYEFLESFYESEAPERYKELYQYSLRLRRLFRDIEEKLRSGDTQSSQASLFNFESDGELFRHQRKQIQDVLGEIAEEIRAHPELRESVSGLEQFRPICMDALSNIATNEFSISHEQRANHVKRISSVYYNSVWQWPCLHISKNTAKGPNREQVVHDRNSRLPVIEKEVESQINQLEDELC